MKVFLTALAFLTSLCSGCSEAIDRDVKFAIGFDSTSNCYWVRYSLAHIAEGLKEIDKWVTDSGFEMLVSRISMGDASKTNHECVADYEANLPIGEIRQRLTRMGNIHYKAGKSPHTIFSWILMNSAWPRKYAKSERRVMLIATSDWPKLGTIEVPEKLPAALTDLCPLENKVTVEQVRESIRGNGVGVYVWLWRQWIESLHVGVENWKQWLDQMSISDYYMTSNGWNFEMDNAKTHFLQGARTLLCPSWIATTTTWAPFADSAFVRDCVESVGRKLGVAVTEDATTFREELTDCVFKYDFKGCD